MAQHIKLSELKQQLSLETVLEHYQLRDTLKQSGQQLRGPCPFCEATKAFTVKDNLYKCFRCNAAGSIVDFVMQTDGLSIRAAALKLQELLTGPDPSKQNKPSDPPKKPVTPNSQTEEQAKEQAKEQTKHQVDSTEDTPLRPCFEEVWNYLEAKDAPKEIYEALGKIEDSVSTYLDHYYS